MKSYLSLIRISANVHKRQNKMTLLCIIISVFLVTTIFSLSDMILRTETTRMMNRKGNWHLTIKDISGKEAAEICKRSDVTAAGWFDVFNFEGAEPYYVGNKKAALYGVDESYITQISNGLSEGTFPQNDTEVMLGTNAKKALNVGIGDTVLLQTPAGSANYSIVGFGEDDKEYYQGQSYLIGVYMTRGAFQELLARNGMEESSPAYYVQFQDAAKAGKAKAEILKQYGLAPDCISENTGLMGLAGTSDSKAMKNIYGIAAVLFVLVLLAGVLMISGSMNSNVTQRIKFFGMMRCIGASREQIIRFVRLEALDWCKTAVPVGVILGTVVSWGVCGALRFGIGGEFAETPLFAVSAVGVVSGVMVGIVTVLLAAQSPAKRAAKVSPVAAVSGATQNRQSVGRAANVSLTKIETALGIRHAVAAKKNWCLMTGSFALSIILFLCFSVGMDFARALLPSLRAWQPDCTINGYANACSLDRELVDEIHNIPGVANAYGNMYISDVEAASSQTSVEHVNLISYDAYMLDCLADSVVQGDLSKIYGDSNKVLTVYNNSKLNVGDTIQMAGEEVEIACAVSDALFAGDLSVICSEETFTRLMGEQKYAMINVKLTEDATDETINQISALAKEDQIFTDHREGNQQSNATYWATRIMGYGFLTIIGMITLFYIVNSISMSVSARVKQYGSMRAVGMDGRQLTKMIAAEAFTYAISGFLIGCLIGLPLNRFLYSRLITQYFGTIWSIPAGLLAIICLFVFAAAFMAIGAPSRRMKHMAITDTINEL